MKNKKLLKSVGTIVCVIVAAVLIILPPSRGRLPEPKTPNGLSERAELEVDGGSLGLFIISQDISNPVLIVCGGGPGIPQYLLEYLNQSPIPEVFTVCYWDYRGTGGSYDPGIDPSAMTTERYLKDTQAVTDYLRNRFSQDKIYIMGHSFGTYIAAKTVQAHPEKYAAYIAMSQIVDQVESENIAFDYMKEEYRKAGNDKMVKEFEKYHIFESRDDFEMYCQSGLRDKAMHDLGVGTTRKMDNVITGLFFPSLRCTTYTQKERIEIWKGKIQSSEFPVSGDTNTFNAFEDIPSMEIPVYFMVGKYDYTCLADLQVKYYEALDAPKKKIYFFENSAHSPLYEEYDKAKIALEEIVEDNK